MELCTETSAKVERVTVSVSVNLVIHNTKFNLLSGGQGLSVPYKHHGSHFTLLKCQVCESHIIIFPSQGPWTIRSDGRVVAVE